MPTPVRIATFNCENLFNRPKLFTVAGPKSQDLLAAVAQLQAELLKPVFDHAVIAALEKKLMGYASVNDVRGKHDTAIGATDWLGWVEFEKTEVGDVAVENTARVIADVNADVICLMEIENRPRLQAFHDQLLYAKFLKPGGRTPYQYVMLIDGNDERGIDVAVLSRLPLGWMRSHIADRSTYMGKPVPTFSRDCLEVDVRLPDGKDLHLVVNHLKSQGYTSANDPAGTIRRRGQAEQVAKIVGQRDLTADYVVVAGDMNTDGGDGSLDPLITNPQLYNANLNLPAGERGTFGTGKGQLDYLLMSLPLKQRLQAVHIERRGVFSKTAVTKGLCYPTVTSARTSASDHCAVSADFLF